MTRTMPAMTSEVLRQADVNFCRAILPQVSRTFALSIEGLPDGLREAVRAAYLLCRIVDTIEDEPILPGGAREQLFDAFERQVGDDHADVAEFEARAQRLRGEAGAAADLQLCRQSGAVFRCFRELPPEQRAAIRPHVLEMSTGMRQYCRRLDQEGVLQIRDMHDLETYCYFVAGTVGGLLTALFAQAVPQIAVVTLEQLRERAVPFGMGLQMVNILKDVACDRERRVSFLPADLLAREHVPVDQVLRAEYRQPALAVVREVARRARQHLEEAQRYTLAWPGAEGAPVRLFCAVPLALAFITLEEIETGDSTLRPGQVPKVSRRTVEQLLEQVGHCAADPVRLGEVLDRHAQSR